MKKKINANVFEEINKVAIRELELDECGKNEIVCEVIYTFVSPATELRVLEGHYSNKKDFPLIPGYSAVARVVEVGAKVKGFRIGDLVSGRNPSKPVPGINSFSDAPKGYAALQNKEILSVAFQWKKDN